MYQFRSTAILFTVRSVLIAVSRRKPRVCSPETSLSDHFFKTISMHIPKIPIKQKIKIAP
jgi:hypothetical protein